MSSHLQEGRDIAVKRELSLKQLSYLNVRFVNADAFIK